MNKKELEDYKATRDFWIYAAATGCEHKSDWGESEKRIGHLRSGCAFCEYRDCRDCILAKNYLCGAFPSAYVSWNLAWTKERRKALAKQIADFIINYIEEIERPCQI
jgi:hypothetical protein